MLDFLDWDDEELPTRQTNAPASHARPSRQPFRPIRLPRSDPSDPSIEIAPATEVDLSGPMSWAPTLPESVLARLGEPPPFSAPPPDTARSRLPSSGISPGRTTLVSEPWIPPPTDSEQFDRRTTARRAVAVCPASVAVPLLHALPPVDVVRRSHSSLPPVVVSSPRSDDELLQEVLRLRRWVRFTGALSITALAACTVLAALLLRTQDRSHALEPAISAQEAPIAPRELATVKAHSALGGLRLAVDGRDRGKLPLELTDIEPGRRELRFTGPVNTEPLVKHVDLAPGEVLDLGNIALEPRAIEVRIHTPSPSTVVSLARQGEPSQIVPGPFPRTLRLPPGTYAVFAARGAETWSHPLYLTSERGNQEVLIHFAH